MLEFDRFIMARMEELKSGVRRAYEAFDFQTAFHAILNFVVVDLSSLYIDVARDRLYCDGARSRERRSAQTALYLMLDALVRMLAPLMPFTADEIYSYVPGRTREQRPSADARRSRPALCRRRARSTLGRAAVGARSGPQDARDDAAQAGNDRRAARGPSSLCAGQSPKVQPLAEDVRESWLGITTY